MLLLRTPSVLILIAAYCHYVLFAAARQAPPTPVRTSIAFQLQNEYSAYLRDDSDNDPHQIAFDVSDPSNLSPSNVVTVQATPTVVLRPRSPALFQHARLRSLHESESEQVEWDRVHVLAPDVQDKHTLSQLARMTGNAYALPGKPNWYEIDPAWNTVSRGAYGPQPRSGCSQHFHSASIRFSACGSFTLHCALKPLWSPVKLRNSTLEDGLMIS